MNLTLGLDLAARVRVYLRSRIPKPEKTTSTFDEIREPERMTANGGERSSRSTVVGGGEEDWRTQRLEI